MKNRILRVVLCALLIAAMTAVPMAASASKSLVMILKTTVEGARLREGPTSAYEVVRSLDKGEKVFYSGQTDSNFCLVRTTKGEVGYIYEGFLTNYGNVRTDMVWYANGYTRIYSSPSTGSSRSGSLEKNEHVLMFRTSGDWAFIRTMTGRSGYVPLSAISSF